MSKDLVRDGVNPGQHLLRLAWLSTILLAIVAALGLAASEDFLPFVVVAWSIAFQFAIAFSAAAVEPYTEIAFAILAPMLPLGSAALWSAQHGFFAQRGSGPA